MKFPNLLAGILLVFVCALNAQAAPSRRKDADPKAEDAKCVLLYGKGRVLTFCAPAGWVMDKGPWKGEGIYAILYPEGSTLHAARETGTAMYINVVDKGQKSLARIMEDDASDVKTNSPSAVVKPGDPIKFSDGIAPVQEFVPGAYDRYEAVAYMETPHSVLMFVVSSINADLFKRDYPAFAELVRSYKFVSSDENVEVKPSN